MIPHEYIEELTRRTDIVELVGSYVQLKRKGRLYGGLCPFHSEKSPFFYVYPDTQSFYCFGCGAGGDAITFAKKINSIDYPEAVKMLAARAGMPEPQEDDKTGRMRSRILSMNKEAARFFHACLNSTVEEARQARAYWRRRGLDDKTIVRFGLGYAPNDGQALYQFLRDKGYNQQELDASGLFKRSPSGRIYCLFWKRVMTPIFDLRGNIIAFGGRVLDDSKPRQQPGNAGLPQVGHGIRAADRQAQCVPAVRAVRGLYGRHQYAAGRHRHSSVCLRHGPDPGSGAAHQRVRGRGHPELRLGRGGPESHPAVAGAVPQQPGQGGRAADPRCQGPG